MSAVVTLENVTMSYARHPAVHHVSGAFARGSLTAITGPNGGGKSTLLKGIAGMLTPDEGHIKLSGVQKNQIAYLAQVSELQRDFPLSVLHLVTMGTWHISGGFAPITAAMKERARTALHTVGLGGYEHRSLASLSSGQLQRALFARLLVQDAQLILLDEPFTAIDSETTLRLLDIIEKWHKEGRTVICVLHDFDQIRTRFPECILLARECIAWGNSTDTLNPERLMQAHFFREGWNQQPEVCQSALGGAVS